MIKVTKFLVSDPFSSHHKMEDDYEVCCYALLLLFNGALIKYSRNWARLAFKMCFKYLVFNQQGKEGHFWILQGNMVKRNLDIYCDSTNPVLRNICVVMATTIRQNSAF